MTAHHDWADTNGHAIGSRRATRYRCSYLETWLLLTQQEHILAQVYQELTNLENSWSFGIHGLGGVGQTQLALKYISTFQHMYSHMFWIVGTQGRSYLQHIGNCHASQSSSK